VEGTVVANLNGPEEIGVFVKRKLARFFGQHLRAPPGAILECAAFSGAAIDMDGKKNNTGPREPSRIRVQGKARPKIRPARAEA